MSCHCGGSRLSLGICCMLGVIAFNVELDMGLHLLNFLGVLYGLFLCVEVRCLDLGLIKHADEAGLNQ